MTFTTAKKRALSALLCIVLALSCLAGCVTQERRNPTATITFSTGDTITVRLYYDKAPNTVKNFITLAQSGFYDGLTVHRVVKYTLVQMGDPNGDGTGGPGYSIEGEFANNGYSKNDLSFEEGVVGMARRGSTTNDEDYYDTAGSQFFITLRDCSEQFDGDYAAFGKVIDGLDAFEEIGGVETDSNNKPIDEITIESIVIETYGEKYGSPKTLASN
jgi:peptidyl-prolyl cis-trans isomerase B (cyclophilin B)